MSAIARASYRRMLAAHGESVQLDNGADTAAALARIMAPDFNAVADTVEQAQPSAIVLAEDLGEFVPERGNTLTTASGRAFMVVHVDGLTRAVAGVTIAYVLHLAGA